jgi:hypothetical protein
VRRTLGLLAAAAAGALAALILGEYEMTLWTAVASGVIVGFLIAEIVLIAASWRGIVPAVAAAFVAGGSILWAAWISSGNGLAPLRATSWAGVVLGAVVAGARLAPWRSVRPRPPYGAANDAN